MIKSSLCRNKGFNLPRRSIETVYNKFLLNVQLKPSYHYANVEEQSLGEDSIACQTLAVSKALQPAIKKMIDLCDWAVGRDLQFSLSGLIGEYSVSQRTPSSSQGRNKTPFKVPSVISLFSSPNSPVQKEKMSPFSKDLGDSTPLRVKMLKHKSTSASKEENKRRFTSCCAWAPNDISPVTKDSSPNQISPITGPTLKVVSSSHKSKVDWDVVFKETPKNRKETKTKVSIDKPKKKSSKRSLLSDISNLQEEPEAKIGKTKERDETNKLESKSNKKSKKSKVLPSGQLQITSFFRK